MFSPPDLSQLLVGGAIGILASTRLELAQRLPTVKGAQVVDNV